MNDLIIWNDIDIDDVRYETININCFDTKIIPYNVKSRVPLHKFWVYIDKCKIINKFFLNDCDNISIALSLNNDAIPVIKKIEKKVNTKIINDEVTHFITISKLHDIGSGVPTFDVILDGNVNMFDENDSKINSQITIGTELSVICELDHFILSHSYLKSYWRIIQLKKIKSINLTQPLFPKILQSIVQPVVQPIQQSGVQVHINPQLPSFTSKQQEQHMQPIQQSPQQQIQQTQPTKQTQQSTQQNQPKKFMIPTAQDLANAISGLKKANSNSAIKRESEIKNLITEQPKIELKQLKHVETKVTDVYQMLKNEHEEKLKLEREKVETENTQYKDTLLEQTETKNKQKNNPIISTKYENIQKLERYRIKMSRYRNRVTNAILQL